MTLRLTRRDFVKASSSASAVIGLGGLGALARFGPVTADEGKLQPDDVRLSPDIEPLVRLIETTPREKIVAMMIEQLRRGATYRKFLAAMFLASTRMAVSPHHFYMIHSAYQLSLNVTHEERLLPFFWALHTLPYGRTEGKTRFPRMRLALAPAPAKAAAAFDAAMAKFDPERAEVALLVLARSEGPKRALSRLWHYAGRDHGDIGHPAISLVNTWRTLETVGWQHAESVCQYVARMPNWAKAPSRLYETNVERAAKGIKTARADWAGGRADDKATRELFALLREGDANGACKWTYEALSAGKAQAGTIWDAIFLASADFMIRYDRSEGIGARPVHLNTTENALHYAFGACDDPQTRLYKATTDAHNVKFPSAIFENYEHVSPRWRPHLLAASVQEDLHGTQMEDNSAVKQAREALRKL